MYENTCMTETNVYFCISEVNISFLKLQIENLAFESIMSKPSYMKSMKSMNLRFNKNFDKV